jgi:hypothetical protein
MNAALRYATEWKWCALASAAMVFLSLLPQIHLWIVRGGSWNGAYVSCCVDEPLYSGYINALIDGRSRKNDPFGGRDSTSTAPLPESIFSIQFLPAYAISLLARIFGISASTAFIVLTPLTAFLASVSVFSLVRCVTGDHRLAFAGTLVVLCLGGFAGSYGIFGTLVDVALPALPFLRRYQPAAAFPLFFVFNLLVWRALNHESKRNFWLFSLLAGVSLSVLIFSYLYLWAAAAAWLACIGVLWFCFRPSDRRKSLAVLTTIGGMAAIAFVPYFYLLSHRAVTLDQQQILMSTHRPDLFRVHEILGSVTLIAIIIAVLIRRIEWRDPRVLHAASLALLPFLVFNQQVVTGKTIQVFHFETYVVNYSTLVAILITIRCFWKTVSRRLVAWMAALSFSWGVFAAVLPARVILVPLATADDQRVPVLRRLKELSKGDGGLARLRAEEKYPPLVYSPSVALIRLLPTWTSQGTLLDITGTDCGSVSREEQKHFFHMHLYYSGVNTEALRKGLHGTVDQYRDELSFARSVVFGQARLFPQLNSQLEPIQPDEIEREVQIYQTYTNSFSREEAMKRLITYAVVPAENNFDFSNLDRWYERDAGERWGGYTLYHLALRPE